jgi:hypothetical protein
MARAALLLLLLCACSPPVPPASDGGEGEDAGSDAGRPDAGAPSPLPGCSADNRDDAVAARDGFREWCADAGGAAQCGDGSPLKLSWRESPDGGTGLFLYFRENGRCTDYLGCWGRDGKGGVDDRKVAGLTNTARTSPRVATFGFEAHGLFNTREPGNALAGFGVVHAPDCTGDLGARDEVVDFARPMNANFGAPASVRTYFRGARDVEAAVAVAKEKFPAPSRIVLGGTGSGAYFAMEALPRVAAAYPGVPLTVLFDGETGVGDAALGAKFTAALQSHDGVSGRPLARFVSVSFAGDPVQRGSSTAVAFWTAQEATLRARQAANPLSFRWFTPALDCHAIAMTPGLWSKYVPWTGGLRPAQPPQRPNPDLAVDGGVLEPWLFSALTGTGAFSGVFESVPAELDAGTRPCTLPDSLEP